MWKRSTAEYMARANAAVSAIQLTSPAYHWRRAPKIKGKVQTPRANLLLERKEGDGDLAVAQNVPEM